MKSAIAFPRLSGLDSRILGKWIKYREDFGWKPTGFLPASLDDLVLHSFEQCGDDDENAAEKLPLGLLDLLGDRRFG
jgi:hypothetical protein